MPSNGKIVSQTKAQRQQEATPAAPAAQTATEPRQPRSLKKKGTIVRTKYHVRSDTLIQNLPEPPIPTKPSGDILQQLTIDFYVCGLYHAALRPPYLIDL